MTAIALLQGLSQALFVLITALVVVDTIRQPRRVAVDTALFFGAATAVVLLSALVAAHLLPSSPLLGALSGSLILVLPYLLLRLVDDFVDVPAVVMPIAALGLVLSIAALFVLPSPMPLLVVLLLVLYFVVCVLYAAGAFVRAAQRSTGVTRRRMEAIAAGSLFLGLVIFMAGVQALFPPFRSLGAGLGALWSFACGLAYYLGFATPGVLRRAWQGPGLRAFLAAASSLAEETDLPAVTKTLEHSAAVALGVSQAAVGLWDGAAGVLRFSPGGVLPQTLQPGHMITGRAFAEQRPIYSANALRDDPANADRYRAARVAAVLAAPMRAGGRRVGTLSAYAERPPFFAADDIALLELLAQIAAVILDYARTYEAASARVRAEQERDQLRQMLEVLPEGVILVDDHGRVLLINPTALAISGHTVAQDVDMDSYPTTEVLHPDGTPYRLDDMPVVRSLRSGEVVRGEDLLLVRPDGSRIPVLFSSAPLRNGGRITGGVAVYQDISALRELDRQKEAFLAGVSHDLKNPLMAIRGQAQLIRRRVTRGANLEPSQLGERLAEIEASTDRVTEMLNELLDVTRLQMNRPLDLDRGPVDLVALSRQVADEYQRSTATHTMRVEALVPALVGDWDEARLRRVLENLLSNAIKYSPQGGAVVITVTPRTEQATDWAVAAVRDQGLGIPAADLPHIFERFRRGSNVRGRVAGTGLGLAGSRQIIEQHGGTIAVESEEGEGTTVTIRLPLASEPEPPFNQPRTE